MKKISILNGELLLGIDYSDRGADVVELSDDDFSKIQNKTHYFDIETKELVEIPQPEPVQPTEEELAEMEAKQKEQEKENAIQEVEKLLLRKQAMELVGETTDSIVTEIATKAEEIIDLSNATNAEKTALKGDVMTKL